MRSILLIGTLALGAAALGVGCVAHAQATGYSEADAPIVFSEQPTLVAVEPDVWVVRDYDYSVYYVGDYYWVYRDDVWHRSRTYQGGWTTVEATVVPKIIVSRDQHAYVHYHGAANAQVRTAPHEQVAAGSVAHTRHDPSEHADDHHDGPPVHGDRAGGTERRDEAEKDGQKENVRRNDSNKREEPRADDKKKSDKKERKEKR